MSWDGRIRADARAIPLADGCVQCVVTSPPYWGLRDYGNERQIGLERKPAEYVDSIRSVFLELRRVLKDDGVCWLNLGDSYSQSGRGGNPEDSPFRKQATNRGSITVGSGSQLNAGFHEAARQAGVVSRAWSGKAPEGLKPKDLVGIPWLVAKALQAPQYVGRIPQERDRVWLAATIDAEGTICGFTHTRKDNGEIRRGIHITVTNTNRLMLDECFRIWETSRQDHNLHGRGHLGKLDSYRWIAHDVTEKAQLLAELYPYLICKKKQALLAWNFLKISEQARGRNKGDEGSENRDRCAWIVHALSKLNHLEPVDIPHWINEPPSLYTPGWYLRSDIIWAKPNPMPESVTDRPTKAHEYIFLLTKSERYFYDADAIAEPATAGNHVTTPKSFGGQAAGSNTRPTGNQIPGTEWAWGDTKNKRSVWHVSTQPYPEAHYATFPEEIPETCIRAGSRPGDLILDPFFGSGTVGRVAERLSRRWVGLDLGYQHLQAKRLQNVQYELLPQEASL